MTTQGDSRLSMTFDNGVDNIDDNPALATLQIIEQEQGAAAGLRGADPHYWTQVLIGKTAFSLQKIDPAGSGPLTRCNGSSTDDPWRCKGYGAANFLIHPCVREYNASVENGKLCETLLFSTDPTLAWGSNFKNKGVRSDQWTLGVIDTHCTTVDENTQLEKQGYKLNTARFLPYNVTNDYRNPPARAPFSRCTYAFD